MVNCACRNKLSLPACLAHVLSTKIIVYCRRDRLTQTAFLQLAPVPYTHSPDSFQCSLVGLFCHLAMTCRVIFQDDGLCMRCHTEFSYCVLNFQGVKILDVIAKQRITNVPRDDISLRPDMYPCSLCWKDNLTLIIGWGNSVKVQLPVFVINACCYHRQTEDYF